MVARYDVINSIGLATSKKNARYFLYKKITHSIVPRKEKYLIRAYFKFNIIETNFSKKRILNRIQDASQYSRHINDVKVTDKNNIILLSLSQSINQTFHLFKKYDITGNSKKTRHVTPPA